MTARSCAIESLEVHVAHACNLACESCSHSSNHTHRGTLSVEAAEASFALWSHRLQPRVLCLLGGEPTLNPNLTELVRLARRCWPEALLRVSTNGLLLHRHPDLPAALQGNAKLDFTIHHASAEYAAEVESAVQLARRWEREHGLRVSFKQVWMGWTQRYTGFGASMAPFSDGQPRQSWEVCPAKHAPQLHEGRIWKCAPLAYLPMQHARYGLGEAWRPYLAYQPLEATATDDEVEAFFRREDEPTCAMCPATPRPLALPAPLRGAR